MNDILCTVSYGSNSSDTLHVKGVGANGFCIVDIFGKLVKVQSDLEGAVLQAHKMVAAKAGYRPTIARIDNDIIEARSKVLALAERTFQTKPAIVNSSVAEADQEELPQPESNVHELVASNILTEGGLSEYLKVIGDV